MPALLANSFCVQPRASRNATSWAAIGFGTSEPLFRFAVVVFRGPLVAIGVLSLPLNSISNCIGD
jgi:hypothetical protein